MAEGECRVLLALVVGGDWLAAGLEKVHGVAALFYIDDGNLNSYTR